jgi:aldose 1-epimerase
MVDPMGAQIENADKNISLLRLFHPSGQELSFTNLGATWVSWCVPEDWGSGRNVDVILGYDQLESYGQCKAYLGATIGRYANRIAHGTFMLPDCSGEGTSIVLARNDGQNHIHGGPTGLHQKIWRVLEYVSHVKGVNSALLKMEVESPHGEGGYPGHLRVVLEIELNPAGELIFTYQAISDRKTVINLTHHPYFNLSGVLFSQGPDRVSDQVLLGDTLREHLVMIDADWVTEITENLIPTGALNPVKDTPFDFGQLRSPATSIDVHDLQLLRGKGYDHFFVFNPRRDKLLKGALSGAPQAQLFHPKTGRLLEMWTNQPGVQLYTGNWLDGSICGKGGRRYGRRSGICLEPQNFPDAPHHLHFTSSFLEGGEVYENRIIYRLKKI